MQALDLLIFSQLSLPRQKKIKNFTSYENQNFKRPILVRILYAIQEKSNFLVRHSTQNFKLNKNLS